ncbi:MAG: diguanylate cyclase [Rhodopseudomonas palustris]|nr:diguanylate cyclase [Rhodopseudomonas palustris]
MASRRATAARSSVCCCRIPRSSAASRSASGCAPRSRTWRFRHRTSPFERVTISIGVAGARPSCSGSPRDLLEAADAALYAAKHRGRNAVAEHGLPPSFERDVALAS